MLENRIPTIYLMIDATMSRISHKWIIKIGSEGADSKRKLSARQTDFNEKSAISTKDWVQVISIEFKKTMSKKELEKFENIVRENKLWLEYGKERFRAIEDTELVVFRGNFKSVIKTFESISQELKNLHGLSINLKNDYKNNGSDINTLKRISKEIERRIELKDQIDKIIGKIKNNRKNNIKTELNEFIRLTDKQYKLHL